MLDVINDVKAYMDNESNETELSHRWPAAAGKLRRALLSLHPS
jgi:hypothetical protein